MTAAFAEGLGVFLLLLVIFSVTAPRNAGRPSADIAPLFIGLTTTMLINVIGPLTNAGLNPFRDLMPRVWAAFSGWGSIAFGSNALDTLIVYMLAPLVGAAIAALLYRYILDPMHQSSSEQA